MTSTLHTWAVRHGVSSEALDELRQMLIVRPDNNTLRGASESVVSKRIQLEASYKGVTLWRNNVGACQDKSGRVIRYGLANDSKKMNEHIKSSDLIGVRPVTITQNMVGGVIGQFVSREVKKGDWTFKGDAHELAQLRWLELVVSLGGDACFASGEGSI